MQGSARQEEAQGQDAADKCQAGPDVEAAVKESMSAPMELMSTALAAIKIKKPRPGARTRNA